MSRELPIIFSAIAQWNWDKSQDESERDWYFQQASHWLLNGRRWPIKPSPQAERVCERMLFRVLVVLSEHGWEVTPKTVEVKLARKVISYQVATYQHWTGLTFNNSSPYSQPYAAVTGAFILRRKARHWGLWVPARNLFEYEANLMGMATVEAERLELLQTLREEQP